jgi:hypothetical protein
MTNEEAVELGATMWLMMADAFNGTMGDHGIDDPTIKTLVFAGFISSASGHMLKIIGASATQHVLDTAKKGCADCMRGQLKVVKP